MYENTWSSLILDCDAGLAPGRRAFAVWAHALANMAGLKFVHTH